MNAKNTTPAGGPVVPSQTMPGPEAAALFTQPLPSEPAAAHTSPVPDGHGLLMVNVVQMAALAQREAALAAATEEYATKRSHETPATFDAARTAVTSLQQAADDEARLAGDIRRYFGPRLDRTKAVVTKVIAIYVLLAIGEVMLNASAGVAQGEPVVLAVISFLGLSAGAVAIGWVVGTRLADAADRISAGPLPQEAEGRGLDALFLPRGKGPLAAVTPDLWFWMLALVGLAVVNAMLVSTMRAEAGMSTAWGPVAGLLVIVAAAPPYLLRNKLADVLEESQRRAAAVESQIKSWAQLMEKHTAAQHLSWGAQATAERKANAQYLAALAGGFGQIVTRQSHIVGHTAAQDQMPVRIDQMQMAPGAGPLIEASGSPVTDYDRVRETLEPAVAEDDAADQPADNWLQAGIGAPWMQTLETALPSRNGHSAHQGSA